MKRIFLILLLSAILFPVSAQSPEASQRIAQLTFAESTHDFGAMHYKSGRHEHLFHFTNTGDAPLVIQHTEVTCSCLKVSYDKKPVPPGGKGTVKVTYTPKKEFGSFNSRITIFTNGADRRHTLTLKGSVTK